MGRYVLGMVDGTGHVGALAVRLEVVVVQGLVGPGRHSGGHGRFHEHGLQGRLVLYVFG